MTTRNTIDLEAVPEKLTTAGAAPAETTHGPNKLTMKFLVSSAEDVNEVRRTIQEECPELLGSDVQSRIERGTVSMTLEVRV